MPLDADTAVVRSHDVLGETVGAEVVLLELGADRYFRLNGTGARLWQALEQPTTPRALASLLSSDHGIDTERALGEVEGFLNGLAARGLIHTAGS
jgi:hypothetical protein